VDKPKPTTNETATALAAPKASLFRRTIFWKRYTRPGGRARTGSFCKWRWMSVASASTVS